MRVLIPIFLVLLMFPFSVNAQKVCDFPSGAPILSTDYWTVSKNCVGTKKVSAADIASYIYSNAPGINAQVYYRSGGSLVTGDAGTIRVLLGLSTVAATGSYSDLSGLPSLDTMASESASDYYTATALDSLLSAKANASHNHAISETTGLQSALDGKVDENSSIIGATKTKITYDNKGLVTAGADATTADISDSTNKRYVTDAQLSVIENTSGTNTGDQINITGNSGTASSLAANGANCSAGSAPLGVSAAGAAENCTDFEEDLSNSSGLAAALSDESGTGVVAFTNSPVFVTPNIGNATGNLSGNASTATALAANGANCSAGSYPLGVDASGAVEGCTAISAGGLSDGDYGDIVFSSSGTVADIDTGVIINADVSGSAAIDASKIADGSVSSIEFQYINTLSSNAQTQISNKQAADSTLTAWAAFNSNGLLTQTASDTFASRTITGTSNRLSVANGDGVSGNPTLDISNSYVGQSTITTLGTVTTGVWNATAISDSYISSAATWSAKQDGDATLTALAGVSTSADKVIFSTGADAFSTTDLPSYGRTLIANSSASDARTDLGIRANEYCWALSDFNTTAVTAATSLAIEYLPAAFTVTGVRAYTRTAPTGLMTIDINEAGTTILSTKLTIDSSEKTSGTATTAPVISDSSIAANAEITVDVDSTTGGKGLVVCMEGTF